MSIIHIHQYFHNRCQKISLDKPQNTILARFYIPKNILLSSISMQSQLSRREKGYLPQETAQRSLRIRYRMSTSPRTQLIDSRNTWLAVFPYLSQYPQHLSLLTSSFALSPWFWLGTRFLYPSASTHWFVRISRVLASLTQTLPPKLRSGLTIGELARVCLPPKCLTGPA